MMIFVHWTVSVFSGPPIEIYRVDCFRDESDFDSAVVCILILR